MNPITFEVSGIPQTAGSKRSFVIPRKGQPLVKPNGKFNGRVIITDDNPKGKDWKNRVADKGRQAMADADLPFDRPLFEGPLEVLFQFRLPRLKAHFKKDGSLKQPAPIWPISRPDALKIARCAEDALTGVAWRDDSQIVIERLEKIYSDSPGATITITPLSKRNHIPETGKMVGKQAALALA